MQEVKITFKMFYRIILTFQVKSNESCLRYSKNCCHTFVKNKKYL